MHEAVLNIFHVKIHKFSQFCSPNSSSANVFAVFTITLQSLYDGTKKGGKQNERVTKKKVRAIAFRLGF